MRNHPTSSIFAGRKHLQLCNVFLLGTSGRFSRGSSPAVQWLLFFPRISFSSFLFFFGVPLFSTNQAKKICFFAGVNYGSKLSHQGTAGFSPRFFARVPFWVLYLKSHFTSAMAVCQRPQVLLLAQLLRSFESGDSDDKAEAPEAEPGVAPVLDVAAKLRLRAAVFSLLVHV